MNRKSLFRKVSVLLACMSCCCFPTFAADGESVSFGVLTYSMIGVLLVLLVFVFIYIRKIQSQFSGYVQTSTREKDELEKLQRELSEKNDMLEAKQHELEEKSIRLASLEVDIEEQKTSFLQKEAELMKQLSESEMHISTLANNKKELEQLLVAKIKENDIIQREATERQEEAERQIREAGRIHDSFFIETIHEMRTPLSLVLGSLALVVQNKDREEDMSTQLLSAYRNTLAMQDLADQLIGTRRSNDVASYLRVARYDMVDIARQCSDLFVDWVAMNNVDFRIHTQTKNLWVWMDRRKMEFTLRMLLSNAFKNTFAYGKVAMSLSVVREDGKAYCTIKVSDEGLDEEKGARRGLRQVMDMVEDIGGMYRTVSDTNGTSYTVMLPLGKQHLLDRRVEFVEPEADLVKLNDRQKEEIAELIQVIPEKKETGKKLLVIDDSDQIRWFLKHVFAKEYQVLEARNGEEGTRVALEEQPDLILCDVMMPVKDGYQTCREIKSDSQLAQVPVVMLTAKVESEDVITGIEAGADDYITKPFDVEILRSKINSLMKKREDMQHYYTNNQPVDGDEEKAIPTNPFMDAVVKTIEKHLEDSTFEAKVLADSLNMSLPTLYRKIKQYSDLSILELTRNIRLKKAAQLLLTQQYSVQEVAEMVGFNDTATFRKRFTEQYNVTPSQYGQPS